jgi:hypothetical protein
LVGHNLWPPTENRSDSRTGGEKHASKEKGCKEEEVTTEHLQVSFFPRPGFAQRALFSSQTTSASTAKGQHTFILRPRRRNTSFPSSATY